MKFVTRTVEDFDAGTWYRIAHDPDSNQAVEVRVRRMPAADARRLRKQKVKVRGNVTTINVTQEELRQREEALVCWTGARNMGLVAGDGKASVLYEKLCPGTAFPVGEEVIVDGVLTEGLKRDILTEFPEVMAFIRKKASELQVADDEDEEDAQGN